MHVFDIWLLGELLPSSFGLFDAFSYIRSRWSPSASFSGFRVSAEQEWRLHSVLNWLRCSLALLKRYTEEQKQSCLPLFRCLEPTSSDKNVFSFTLTFLRANSTSCSLQTTLRKTCLERRPTALAYITENLNENSLYVENFPTQSWERKVSDPWICNPQSSLRHNTTSTFEFTWTAKQCFHTRLCCMLICDQMQSLSSSFEFKKVALSTASRVVSSFVFSLSLSPSHRRSPVESAWRTFLWDTSSPSFSAFGARFPTIPPWRSAKGSGAHKGQDDTVTPLPPPSKILWTFHPPWPVEGLASLSALRRQRQLFSFAMSSRVSSSAISPPPASHSFRLLLASCPALLPFLLSLLWLVGFSRSLSPVTFTQWCFGCSSGKQVSMFVLFCYYPD